MPNKHDDARRHRIPKRRFQKRILGDRLHARTLLGRQAEATIGVAILNRVSAPSIEPPSMQDLLQEGTGALVARSVEETVGRGAFDDPASPDLLETRRLAHLQEMADRDEQQRFHILSCPPTQTDTAP